MVILEEENFSHPWCPRCEILVPWSVLNVRQLATAQCTRGAERKRRRLSEEELREISERDFQDYGEPLETVAAFRYLGRAMMACDDD